MGKSLLLLLLASTVSAPAFAAGDDERPSRREAARAERAERAEAREERAARAEAREERRIEPSDSQSARPVFENRAGDADRSAAREQRRLERSGIEDGGALVQQREREGRPRIAPRDRFERPDVEQRRRARDTIGDVPRTERVRGDRPRLADRPGARPPRLPVRRPPEARPDVPAPPPPTAVRSSESSRPWHSDWRRDSRYDWYGWRSRNRWLFNLGFYFDPFGWGYRRYPMGWRLWPSYYDMNYWLNDPWMYRLPPPYGPYRWVRYWDDALLVNVYTGEVVDVVYNFFW